MRSMMTSFETTSEIVSGGYIKPLNTDLPGRKSALSEGAMGQT